MNQPIQFVWLASYPRSGNTYLRTILWHCFNLRSGSIYPEDLGNNPALEEYVGHIERNPHVDAQLAQANKGMILMKTHEPPRDHYPAIYVIRDGRAAAVSMWQFYDCKVSLDAVIEGKHRLGSWSDHLIAWNPWERANTLVLHYEDLVERLPKVLSTVSDFLGREIVSHTVPKRDKIAGVDGHWVKKKKSWRSVLSGAQLKRHVELNKAMLKRNGYI